MTHIFNFYSFSRRISLCYFYHQPYYTYRYFLAKEFYNNNNNNNKQEYCAMFTCSKATKPEFTLNVHVFSVFFFLISSLGQKIKGLIKNNFIHKYQIYIASKVRLNHASFFYLWLHFFVLNFLIKR